MIDGDNVSGILIDFRFRCYAKHLLGQVLSVTEKLAVNRIYLVNRRDGCFHCCGELNTMKDKLAEYLELNKYYRRASNNEVRFVNSVAYVIVCMDDLSIKLTNDDPLFFID